MELIIAEGKGFSSKLIQPLTKSRWTHFALRYGGNESDWMIHSTIGGVQPEWWQHFNNKYISHARFKCNFACANKAADKIVSKWGHKPYDYWSFVGFGAYLVMQKLGIKNPFNPLGRQDQLMCSEVAAVFFRECNALDPSLKLPVWDSEIVSPADVFAYVSGDKRNFTYIGGK